ncbi:hypothetical protein BpHYR1_001559 [Brachionus plicatilis]|uniref:Uncharacterized protein n=1 Tax=Brachionus plicatilis TaxID=10195 RepID=A0A3M7Q9X2_BRAPC|nr:hypothetical protein BpHYR1_001559 [Brachionus plicatilis]
MLIAIYHDLLFISPRHKSLTLKSFKNQLKILLMTIVKIFQFFNKNIFLKTFCYEALYLSLKYDYINR